jgi:hypothetical protein
MIHFILIRRLDIEKILYQLVPRLNLTLILSLQMGTPIPILKINF